MSMYYGREIENPHDAVIDYIKRMNRVDDVEYIQNDDYLEESFKIAVAIVLGLQTTPTPTPPLKLLVLDLSCDNLGPSNPSKYFVVCNLIDSNYKNEFEVDADGTFLSPFLNMMPLSVVLCEHFKNVCTELNLVFLVTPTDNKFPHLFSCINPRS